MKAEADRPYGIRFMHLFLFASLIVAIISTLLFVIAGLGKSKK